MGVFLSILFHNYHSGLIHFNSHQCFAWFKFLIFSRYLETCWVTSSFASDNEVTWQEATQMEALHLLLGRLAWNRKIYTWTFAPLTTAKIQTLRKAIWSSTLPATKSTLYLVIGCLASLELLGIFFHARFSAEVGGSSEKEKNTGTPYVCHQGWRCDSAFKPFDRLVCSRCSL